MGKPVTSMKNTIKTCIKYGKTLKKYGNTSKKYLKNCPTRIFVIYKRFGRLIFAKKKNYFRMIKIKILKFPLVGQNIVFRIETN